MLLNRDYDTYDVDSDNSYFVCLSYALVKVVFINRGVRSQTNHRQFIYACIRECG